MAERRWGHALEAMGARLAFGFLRLLPLDRASALGGAIGRAIGPRIGASKRAVINLHRAMPELGERDVERIVTGMWDNLGRVVAEFPHLGEIRVFESGGRVELIGAEAVLAARAAGRRIIFFSAHFGNWEIAAQAATQAGFPVVLVYRAANNPFIDRLIVEARTPASGDLVPKGPATARRLVAAMRRGDSLCMLVDQKMNDGIPVPFFGRDAMTAPALARLARRFDCLVVPARVERLEGAHFRLVLEAPLEVPHGADPHADDLALMTAVNATIERWVRADPARWFWIHRRWPD
ncbi:MAG TPA: lauroyl acyltransferase [Stellaceae bacterium]|nr:lauroyl acyltransferase [Stellaceae bacterium]